MVLSVDWSYDQFSDDDKNYIHSSLFFLVHRVKNVWWTYENRKHEIGHIRIFGASKSKCAS